MINQLQYLIATYCLDIPYSYDVYEAKNNQSNSMADFLNRWTLNGRTLLWARRCKFLKLCLTK